MSKSVSHFILKPVALSIHLAIASIASLTTSTGYANTLEQRTYTIAAGSLSSALQEFAVQANIGISTEGKAINGLSSKGLNGNYSIEQGLKQLLIDSPFTIVTTKSGYALVEKPKVQQPQVRDMGQLKTIDVTASGQTKNNGDNVAQLPVITVTAEKNGSVDDGYLVKNITGAGIWNERSLQDTPYSMSVMSSDFIENVQAKDMNQIFKMNPTTQEAGKSNWGEGDAFTPTMRGFTVTNPVVNGISYAGYTTTPMMQDIERVEIISGSTGFLYGGGRVGGAVNYVTKKSPIENLKNITIGSYGNQSYYGHIDLGGKFNQDNTFGYRINALYQNGELANTSETEQKAISLLIDWIPTENFYTDLKYSYKYNLTKGGENFFGAWRSGFDIESIKKNKNYNPDWIENEFKSNRISNSIKYTINDIFTLRTNVFYEELKYRGGSSNLFVQNGNIIARSSTLRKSSWAETKNNGVNIYFDSKFDTGNISHTLTTGYSSSSRKYYVSSDNASTYTFTDAISLNNLGSFAKLEDSLWTNNGIIGTQPRTLNSKRQYQNILIGDDIVFNDKWSALIGANYASITNKSYTGSPNYDTSELTPTFSVIYKPIENLTTYATYIESLEAGSIVGGSYANENEILDPYISKQYEIGAKYSLFDEKALLTAALFRIEKANSYDDTSSVASLGKPTLTQDGEQIHQGLELGLTGKVTDNLTLMGGVTLMDLSVEKATNPALEGKTPIAAAKRMTKLFAEYQIPYIEGLSINVGAYYTDKSYINADNTRTFPSYTLFDAGLRYQTQLGSYPTTFNLTAQNLTDKQYWITNSMIGDPRTVAFSVKTQF